MYKGQSSASEKLTKEDDMRENDVVTFNHANPVVQMVSLPRDIVGTTQYLL